VDRDTAKSVAGIARQRAFPEQIGCGLLIMQIPCGSVAGNAWPSQSSRPASAHLIPFSLSAAAVLIIFALHWRVRGRISAPQRERGR